MKLSIITVNKNHSEGLKRTAESISVQQYKSFEWIVIDGSSVDDSLQVIKNYSKYITYWVSEPDRGIYHAMNKGIRVAHGDYLLFLNSGDYLVSPTVLNLFFNEQRNEDVVYGYVAYPVEGEPQIQMHFLAKDDISIVDFLFKTIPHQATFYKRCLFERFGYYSEEYKIVSDLEFNIKVIIFGNVSVKFVPIIISYFEEGGISMASPIHLEERTQLMKLLIPPRIQKDLEDAISKKEICHNKFFSYLYSFLYRFAVYFR